MAPNAKPPVAKLMDFGKYKYEAAVKARESRKNQTNTVLKEVRFRLKIDTHDYETKVGHAKRFLGAGDKVKAMIQFRGREQQRPEMGVRLLERFANDVAEVGAVESSPRVDGRNMVMVVGPLKNKAEAKAEARRQKQRDEAKAENERKAKDKIDTSSAAPVTQSIGDAFPAELRERAGQAEEPVQQPAPEPEVQEPAPAPEVPETAQAAAPEPEVVEPEVAEPEVAEPEAPEVVETPEPEVAEAPEPEVVEAPEPKAAPAPKAAPKPPAPKAPVPAPKAPRPGPKPGAKPGPQA